MAGDSIYRYIARMAEAHPGLPYSFQSRGAGREDISHVLWEKHVPFAIREEWAQELVDLIPPCLASQSPSPQLQEELIKRPIYMYLSNLSNRIRLYLEEQLVDNKELYSFGIQLATTSSKEADVKLGMVNWLVACVTKYISKSAPRQGL